MRRMGRTTTLGPQVLLRRPREIISQAYNSLMPRNACSQCPASFRSDILRRVCGEVSTVWWQSSRLWKEIITRLFRLKGRRVHFIRGDLSFGCFVRFVLPQTVAEGPEAVFWGTDGNGIVPVQNQGRLVV